MAILPARLNKGDTIGIISPGRWLAEDQLIIGKRALESKGFSVFIHKQNDSRMHQFAGCDKERREAIESLFFDPQIRAIMFSKGGYGTLRILDDINYEAIARNPKVVVGYSDATALLSTLYTRTGLVTFHGPMLYDFLNGANDYVWNCFEKLVVQGQTINNFFDLESGVKIIREGEADGVIFGGNLTLLVNQIGTQSDFDTKGMILFLEDYDEYLYNLDRMFVHLKRSGKLSEVAALVIGSVAKVQDNEVPFGYSIEEIVAQHCSETSFPIVAGFPFGHKVNQLTLPLGLQGSLIAKAGEGVQFKTYMPAVI